MFVMVDPLPGIHLLAVVQLMVIVGPLRIYFPEFLAWVPENVHIHGLPGII